MLNLSLVPVPCGGSGSNGLCSFRATVMSEGQERESKDEQECCRRWYGRSCDRSGNGREKNGTFLKDILIA